MFQNITESVQDKEEISKKNRIKDIIKDCVTVKNVIICVLSLVISTLSIDDTIMPFSLAMIAATISQEIPVFGVFISALIGASIGNGIYGFLNCLLGSIIYFALMIVFRPKVAIEERNEIIKTGGRLFWANFIVTFFQIKQGNVLIYDVFMAMVSASLTYVFYKIFVNGITPIKEWNVKKAFTIEEIICTCIIFSVATIILNQIEVFNLSLSNIFIIFMIMVLGWKKGLLVGATSGLSIGLVISMIEMQNVTQMAVFAVCGIFAGIFSKLGKFGVIIGFILGNSLIVYLSNGQSIQIIYYREIFIAALGLIFVPKSIEFDFDEINSGKKLLSDVGENRLYQSDEMIEKLNNISNVISNVQPEEDFDFENIREEYFDILSQNMEDIQSNTFYEDIVNEDNNIMNDIYDLLQENDIILEKDFIKILKNHNNFVIMQDETIKNDLQEAIKVLNKSYKMLQIEIVRKQEKNKTILSMKNELKNISGVINNAIKHTNKSQKNETKEIEIFELLKSKYDELSSVSIKQRKNGKYILQLKFDGTVARDKQVITNISSILSKSIGKKITFQMDKQDEKYTQIYMNEDKYSIQIGCSKVTKDGSLVSGDCSVQTKLDDGNILLAISDGMGTGKDARKIGKKAINLLEDTLNKGFEEDELINIINDYLTINSSSEMYATLDFSVIDLYKGNLKIAKSGASNTYIKNKKNVNVVKSASMPVGIVDNISLDTQELELSDGDILLMCSDGLLNYQNEFNEEWVVDYLKKINTTNVQKIADLIVAEAVDNNFGKAKDDITVIVAKIVDKK